MKTEIRGSDLVITLDKESQDVADYVLDQFEDRLTGAEIQDVIENRELELDYENKSITVTNIIAELIQRAIEEKEHDIEWEAKHQ